MAMMPKPIAIVESFVSLVRASPPYDAKKKKKTQTQRLISEHHPSEFIARLVRRHASQTQPEHQNHTSPHILDVRRVQTEESELFLHHLRAIILG